MTPSTSESVLAELRRRILQLELAPGERISERGLEALLGGSRTPVRAALFRLQSEGLVRLEGRVWRISPVDADEVEHLGLFRETVEAAAVRLAADGPSSPVRDAALARLEALLDDAGFHVALAELGGNPFLVDALAASLLRLSRVRSLEVQRPESRAASVAEHRAIVAAVARGDADAAARLVVEHAAGVRRRVLERIGAR